MKFLIHEILTIKKKKVEEDLLNTLRKDSDNLVKKAAADGIELAEMKLLIVKVSFHPKLLSASFSVSQ